MYIDFEKQNYKFLTYLVRSYRLKYKHLPNGERFIRNHMRMFGVMDLLNSCYGIEDTEIREMLSVPGISSYINKFRNNFKILHPYQYSKGNKDLRVYFVIDDKDIGCILLYDDYIITSNSLSLRKAKESLDLTFTLYVPNKQIIEKVNGSEASDFDLKFNDKLRININGFNCDVICYTYGKSNIHNGKVFLSIENLLNNNVTELRNYGYRERFLG